MRFQLLPSICRWLPVLLVMWCLAAPAGAQPRETPRTLVHLLDYMAQDYPEAVADGAVRNLEEYAEMQEFAVSIRQMVASLQKEGRLPADGPFATQAERLAALVAARAEASEVAATAGALRTALIAHTGLAVAPATWPDLAQGARLYATHCAACHGPDGGGDGPAAAGLEPPPSVFSSGERVAGLSPFQAYNTIGLGVEGTAMAAYPHLSEDERWALAFFVKSLKARHDYPGAAEADATPLRSLVTLEQVASLHDGALAEVLAEAGVDDPLRAVAILRTAPPPARTHALDLAHQLLAQAHAAYREGDAATARTLAVRAYLEGVEPVEPSLKASSPELAHRLEQAMMRVRTLIGGDHAPEAIQQAVGQAQATLQEAREALGAHPTSPWFAFLMAASILLREGLEAFLIILAMLSVLRASAQHRAARWVHGGWLAALAVGIAAWFFSDRLLQLGGAERELMEGGIALLAVLVLLYVGFWLHSKTEIHKWKAFIDTRIQQALRGGNLWGLAAIAFFAVFREAFESVLFLSALTLEEGPGSKAAIAGGAVLAIGGVLVLAALLLRASARLPIRSLFRYSSFVMGVLSVILAGKAIHAFQETGWLSITPAPLPWRLDVLGVYPTLETFVAQLVILLAVVLLYATPALLRRFAGAPAS